MLEHVEPEVVVFLRKGALKIRSKFTGEHSCQSAISINLRSNFIEVTPGHGRSPVNLLHIFRTPFPKNTSEELLLNGLKLIEIYLKLASQGILLYLWPEGLLIYWSIQ